MITLTVELGVRSYPIVIGSDLLGSSGLFDPYLAGRDVLIVTNEIVAPLYLAPLQKLLPDCQVNTIALPDGELTKTLETVNKVFDALVAHGYGRDCVLLTLGGGVVGDIGGFAAASYQRGVDYLQVPTTLLAQVDSSVGGKTGVNHPGGKNLIGAFHQPCCIVSDTSTLKTLADRELSAGLAEVVKYGLIADAELLTWLESEADALLQRDPDHLNHIVRRCCEIKAAIVAADEREHGQRALLNLGHTFGHAIERCAGYGEWLHGEAVAAGIMMAAAFSERLGRIEALDTKRVRNLLSKLRLPVHPPKIDPYEFLAVMGLDKKVFDHTIHLVLLDALGVACVTADYPSHELVDFLSAQLIR